MEEADILSGHFAATRARYHDCRAHDGILLSARDHERYWPDESVNSSRDKDGRWRHHTVCGMLMHSSLAVTVEGLPLGFAAAKFRTHRKFKGTAQLKKTINPIGAVYCIEASR